MSCCNRVLCPFKKGQPAPLRTCSCDPAASKGASPVSLKPQRREPRGAKLQGSGWVLGERKQVELSSLQQGARPRSWGQSRCLPHSARGQATGLGSAGLTSSFSPWFSGFTQQQGEACGVASWRGSGHGDALEMPTATQHHWLAQALLPFSSHCSARSPAVAWGHGGSALGLPFRPSWPGVDIWLCCGK